MAGLLPSTSDVSGSGSRDPRVIGVDSDEADDLLSALSSRTARRILTELHEDPATPAALADRIDSSLQNTQYHLEKLEAAGLIEVGDIVYSEKGREMNVYVPADRTLVVVAGREEETTGLKATLKRLLGGVGVLGMASLVVDRVLGGPTTRLFTAQSGGADDGAPTRRGDEGGGMAGSGDGSAGGAGGAADGNASTDAASTPVDQTTDYQNAPSQTTEAATETAETTRTMTEGTPTPELTVTEETVSGATATPTPDVETTWTATETTLQSADPTALDVLVSSPGMLFFLGGLTVLLLGFVALWYRR